MPISEYLFIILAKPVAKFLAKCYFGETAADVADGLIDIVNEKIQGQADRREAERQFERIGDKIVERILPLFEGYENGKHTANAEAVAHELRRTLEGRLSGEFFIKADLDPRKLSRAFRAAYPFPEQQFSADETALYSRALEGTIGYLVQVASDLPEFKEQLTRQSLERLTRLGENIETILETTQRIERAVTSLVSSNEPKAAEELQFEIDYRQAVVRNLDYMELFGVTVPDEAAKRHQLSVAYVSLNLKQTSDRADETSSLPVHMILKSLSPEAGRLLIRGEAGSGKSTLFRWIAIQAAWFHVTSSDDESFSLTNKDSMHHTLSNILMEYYTQPVGLSHRELSESFLDADRIKGDLKAFRYKLVDNFVNPISYHHSIVQEFLKSTWLFHVPFIVRLRDCEKGRLPAPKDFPLQVANALGSPPETWVTSVLKSGNALILLDGIDEVPNQHRNRLRQAIEDIINAYPNNYYILSTRPAAVPDDWLAGLQFREANVEPMSDRDKSEFILNWHSAVARELERQGRPDGTLVHKANSLILKLQENPPLSRLASTPLLCAMICALHRDRNEDLPESLRELCEAVCEMLLHRRERESSLPLDEFPEAYRTLIYDYKRAITQDIAHYMVRNEESALTIKQALDIVSEALKRIPSHIDADAKIVLEGFIERSGVLREVKRGYIEFLHNTIKEYLAGERFADERDFGRLAKNCLDPNWQQAVVFAASNRNPKVATELIQRILALTLPAAQSLSNVTSSQTRPRQLLALTCRAVAINLDPKVNEQLNQIERKLFPPRTMADASALALGGDAAVGRLRFRKSLKAREAAACVRALRIIGTPKAQRTLQSYLDDERLDVVSELIEAVNPLNMSYIRKQIVESGAVKSFPARLITDLNPLRDYPALKILNLSSDFITDLAPLEAQTEIEKLDINAHNIKSIASLKKLQNLSSLRLRTPQVEDLSPLNNLPALAKLIIEVTARTLETLTTLPALTELTLLLRRSRERNEKGNHILQDFTGFPRLVKLQTHNGSTVDLSRLDVLADLSTLKLRNFSFNNIQVKPVLTSVKHLELTRAFISDSGFTDIFPNVRTLHLNWCNGERSRGQTKPVDLSMIKLLTSLKALILVGTPFENLPALLDAPELDKMFLSFRNDIFDDVAIEVLKNARFITYISHDESEDVDILRGIPNVRLRLAPFDSERRMFPFINSPELFFAEESLSFTESDVTLDAIV